jgi:preprotein translocase subunit SecE
VARDRKRAKARKERQERAAGTRARADRAPAPERAHEHEPPELASGELDIADAQLALGRPDLADAGDPVAAEAATGTGSGEFVEEQEFERLEDRVDDAEEHFEQASNGHAGDDVELVPRTARASRAPARSEGNRFANFIRGSWRELQRVQWPDRQQVGQATAVVIGFVIVAGAFLGAMDYVAAKIVDFLV